MGPLVKRFVSIETVLKRIHVISMPMQIDLFKFLNIDMDAVVFHGSSLMAPSTPIHQKLFRLRRLKQGIQQKTTSVRFAKSGRSTTGPPTLRPVSLH